MTTTTLPDAAPDAADAPPAKRSKKTPVALAGLELTIAQSALHAALAIAGHAVGSGRVLPVLSHVHLTAEAGALVLRATTLEIGMAVRVANGVQVTHEGAVCVPAALLASYVATLPAAAPVTLAAEADHLRVTSGRATSLLRGVTAADFPLIPGIPIDSASQATVDASLLHRALTLTTFCAAKDEARPVLAGVNLLLDGGALVGAGAADGFRLAVWGQPNTAALPGIIVPRKGAAELARLLDKRGGDAHLWVTSNEAQLVSQVPAADDHPGVTLVLRLLGGQFPDMARFIPKAPTAVLTVSRVALLSAVQQVQLYARDAANVIRLEYGDAGSAAGEHPATLTITGSAVEVGDGESALSATLDGEAASISLDARFLVEVCQALSGDDVRLAMIGPLSPILLTDSADAQYRHVIMPMHAVK